MKTSTRDEICLLIGKYKNRYESVSPSSILRGAYKGILDELNELLETAKKEEEARL